MSRLMLTASEARTKALQDLVVLKEVRDLEEAILNQITYYGEYQVTVSTTTTMAKNAADSGYALATEYYDVWVGANDNRGKLLQMNKVVQYFTDLGYTIDRQTNSTTHATFQWVISW